MAPSTAEKSPRPETPAEPGSASPLWSLALPALGPVPGEAELEVDAQLQRALDESAGRAVRFVLPAMAAFYAVLASLHLLVLPPPQAARMACVAGASAVGLAAAAWRARRRREPRAAHAYALGAVATLYLNTTLHFWLVADEYQSINLLLTILIASLVVLRTRVLVATVAVVLSTWALLFHALGSPHWVNWAFSASLVAFVHHHVQTSNLRQIERLRLQSDALLLNVLPGSIAARLKAGEAPISDEYREATVLFADIVGFTTTARSLAPSRLVTILAEVFAGFDALAARHGVEKIKTIGDAYMAVAGCPTPGADHAERIAALALDLQRLSARLRWDDGSPIAFRIGIHSGPVVAGVIGTRKFSYDLWGDTVNTASRMESSGLAGAIQVSEASQALLRERFDLEERGVIAVKGKGEMRTFLLQGARQAQAGAPRA